MSKNKTTIIFKREFLTRFKSKGFIISTILVPFGMVILMAAPILLTMFAGDSDEKTIAVRSANVQLAEAMVQNAPDQFHLEITNLPDDSLRLQLDEGDIDGYLIFPDSLSAGEGTPTYYSSGGGGISLGNRIESVINTIVRDHRIQESGASAEVIEIMNSSIRLEMIRVSEDGDAADSTGILAAVGYVMGMIIYITMFVYGAIVMRGVIEEKSSRIMEIMASSAKPIQLLLGKVLGIGALGLTQMTIWVIAGVGISILGGTIFSIINTPDPAAQQMMVDMAQNGPPPGLALPEVVPISLLFYFIAFFLGGFLLYSSLFAAVGSAVESEADAQQLQLPLMIPIVIPILFIGAIVESPDSTMAVIMSLIPFFSPILMIVRIAITDVPFWQIGLSLVLLAGAFIGAIWLSSRIYRVGILMYGKRPSFKELFRWMRQA